MNQDVQELEVMRDQITKIMVSQIEEYDKALYQLFLESHGDKTGDTALTEHVDSMHHQHEVRALHTRLCRYI